MALSKQSLLAACQLMLLVCAGMCIICSADFKADVAKQHVAVEHGHLRHHVAKSKVGSFVEEKASAMCVQVSIPTSVPGLTIEGGLQYQVTYKKEANLFGKNANVYIMGGELAVSAGLQFSAVVFKLAFYFTGAIGVENKVCRLETAAQQEFPGYYCGYQVMKTWFTSMFQNKIRRWGRAQKNKAAIGRVAAIAQKIRQNYQLPEAELGDRIQKDGQSAVLEFRDRLRQTAKTVKRRLMTEYKFGKDGKLNPAKHGKIIKYMQVWVTRVFRETFYTKIPNTKFNEASDSLKPEDIGKTNSNDCSKMIHAVKKMMCYMMCTGLLLAKPKHAWSASAPFASYFSGNAEWAIVSEGNTNTYNSILELFPEMFYQGYANAYGTTSDNDGRVDHNDELDTQELEELLDDFDDVTIDQRHEEIIFMKGVPMAALESYTMMVTLLSGDPEKIGEALWSFRGDTITTCADQSKLQANLGFYTSGTFGMTAGSSTVGFCTPDTNLLQFQAGWKTTYEQKTDCLLYTKSREYMPMKLIISFGPFLAVDIEKIWNGDLTIQVRMRLLVDSGLSESEDPPKEETFQKFNTGFGNAIGKFCKTLQDAKLSTQPLKEWGPVFADAYSTYLGAMTTARVAAEEGLTADEKESGFLKILRDIVPDETPPEDAENKMYKKGMSWFLSAFRAVAEPMMKSKLLELLPQVVVAQTFLGVNFEWKKPKGESFQYQFQFAQEKVFGFNGGVVQAYGTTGTKWYVAD